MRIQLIATLCLAAVFTAGAQTTETPVPFDTAGRILSVNQPLATRLGLAAPAWPVTGAFVEARLFQVSTGGFSLTVSRSGGALDRYALDATQAVALRAAFAEAMARAGRVVAEDAANMISEAPRGPFVRDQMLLSAIIYGPALASLTHDGALGSGLYMLSVGGTFFGVNDFARRRTISKSQNALTTDGALRGWAATALTATAFDLELSEDATAITALVGGIGGSVAGYHRGRTLTNSEARAAMTASTLGAGVVLGLGTTVGIIGENSNRAAAAAALGGGIAGYLAGPGYPRRAGYTVTAGDVAMVRLGAVLGAMGAYTPFVGPDEPDVKVVAGALTAGGIAGALIADRIAVKPFNHSEGDARMIQLGAFGGALMGSALPLMSRSENATFWMAMITGGGILGTFATEHVMAPAREGGAMRNPGSNASSARIQLNLEGALLTAAGRRGNHTLLTVRFR